jgi:hypothetical protein
MSDNRNVTGHVRVLDSSVERVALELMQLIAGYEEGGATSTREYWLKLYLQCRKAAVGNGPESVLQKF